MTFTLTCRGQLRLSGGIGYPHYRANREAD